MADETKQDAKAIQDNPKVAEFLAQFATNPEFVQALAKEMSADVAGNVANASKAVKQANSAAAAAAAAEEVRQTGKPQMSYEQKNEFLKCTVLHIAGKPYKVNQELDENEIITQSLGAAVSSAGGVFVPVDVRAELIKKPDEPEIVWPLLTKRPTSKESVTNHEVTGYVTPNTGSDAKSTSVTTTDEVTVTEPTFDDMTWNLRDIDARVPIKLNLLDDADMDILQIVRDLVYDGFRVKREAWPLTGTGPSNEAMGLFNSYTDITSATIASITTDLIVDRIQELPQRYRMSGKAACLMSTGVFFGTGLTFAKNIRTNSYLLDMLPKFIESANVPAGKFIHGDFSRYVVYFNPMLKMISDTEAKRWTLELVFQERWDGQPTITDAFRITNVTSY